MPEGWKCSAPDGWELSHLSDRFSCKASSFFNCIRSDQALLIISFSYDHLSGRFSCKSLIFTHYLFAIELNISDLLDLIANHYHPINLI